LSALDKSKTNKLQIGTNVRNIEKLVYRMNKARGESEAIDAKQKIYLKLKNFMLLL